MFNRGEGHDRSEDDGPAPRLQLPPDPLEALWRVVRPALEIGGLYAMYRHHESTALTTQCLVIGIQSYMDTRRG